jgi:hypothetical protein
MDEAWWLSCEHFSRLLNFLRRRRVAYSKAGRRKLRLFACACCRRLWPWLTDESSRRAVEVAERFADGLSGKEELEAARRAAPPGWGPNERLPFTGDLVRWPANAAFGVAYPEAAAAATCVAQATAQALGGDTLETYNAAWRWQCDVVREVFGNPFRPVVVDPVWLAWNDGTVRGMARDVYDERHFDRLPLLADALEDAGCADAGLLEHLRGPGPHVRGCWALDLLTSARKSHGSARSG